MRRILLYALLPWLFLTSLCLGQVFAECSQGKSTTLIYQPWQADTEKPDIFWNKKIEEIKAAGFSTILLQWSAYGDVQYASSNTASFFSRFLTIAAQHNLNIIVGLWADPAWFAHIKEDAYALDFYLRKVRAKHLAQAQMISREFADHPAIIGWYLPEEIDDREWRAPAKQKLLANHLQETTQLLHTISPELPIMISSFFAGFMTPDDYSAMLARLSGSGGDDLLWLVQDGLGTGRLNAMETGRFMGAFQDQALPYKGVLEIFTQTAEDSGFVSASPVEIRERGSVWCENTQNFPDITFSLRYRFPFTE